MTRSAILAALGLALGTALVAVAPARAGGPPPKSEPRWALSWDAAMQEAKDRNVPIYITFHQDG